jgi:competence protein ComEA
MGFFRKVLVSAVLACASFTIYAEPIDINVATAQELAAALKGVGSARAAAIVAYRDQYGPFQQVEDLTKVSGIGTKLVEANMDNLKIALPASTE